MTARNIVRLVPFPRDQRTGQFDIPADAAPIAHVTFGAVGGIMSHIPVTLWIPFVESTYDDPEPS